MIRNSRLAMAILIFLQTAYSSAFGVSGLPSSALSTIVEFADAGISNPGMAKNPAEVLQAEQARQSANFLVDYMDGKVSGLTAGEFWTRFQFALADDQRTHLSPLVHAIRNLKMPSVSLVERKLKGSGVENIFVFDFGIKKITLRLNSESTDVFFIQDVRITTTELRNPEKIGARLLKKDPGLKSLANLILAAQSPLLLTPEEVNNMPLDARLSYYFKMRDYMVNYFQVVALEKKNGKNTSQLPDSFKPWLRFFESELAIAVETAKPDAGTRSKMCEGGWFVANSESCESARTFSHSSVGNISNVTLACAGKQVACNPAYYGFAEENKPVCVDSEKWSENCEKAGKAEARSRDEVIKSILRFQQSKGILVNADSCKIRRGNALMATEFSGVGIDEGNPKTLTSAGNRLPELVSGSANESCSVALAYFFKDTLTPNSEATEAAFAKGGVCEDVKCKPDDSSLGAEIVDGAKKIGARVGAAASAAAAQIRDTVNRQFSDKDGPKTTAEAVSSPVSRGEVETRALAPAGSVVQAPLTSSGPAGVSSAQVGSNLSKDKCESLLRRRVDLASGNSEFGGLGLQVSAGKMAADYSETKNLSQQSHTISHSEVSYVCQNNFFQEAVTTLRDPKTPLWKKAAIGVGGLGVAVGVFALLRKLFKGDKKNETGSSTGAVAVTPPSTGTGSGSGTGTGNGGGNGAGTGTGPGPNVTTKGSLYCGLLSPTLTPSSYECSNGKRRTIKTGARSSSAEIGAR